MIKRKNNKRYTGENWKDIIKLKGSMTFKEFKRGEKKTKQK